MGLLALLPKHATEVKTIRYAVPECDQVPVHGGWRGCVLTKTSLNFPSVVRSIIWRPSEEFAGSVVTISAQVPSSGDGG